MNVSEIRHGNFMTLFNEFRARHAHLPDRGMLKLYAKELDISDRYLSHVKCARKAIGHATARQIEEKSGKQNGWLDAVHSENEPRSLNEKAIIDTFITLLRSDPGAGAAFMNDLLKTRLGRTQ